MEALDREGNTAEALLVYDALRCRLRDDLGVTPSPADAGAPPPPAPMTAASASRAACLLGVLLRAAHPGADDLVVDQRGRREGAVVRRPVDVQGRVVTRSGRCARAAPAARSCGRRATFSAYSIRGSNASTIAGSIASKPCSR